MKQIEFNIGDKVFWARYEAREVTIECPVCFGNKEVTVILGNTEQIKTPCEYCTRGFSEPLGCVTEYEYVSDIKEITINGKEVSEDANGKNISYRLDNYILDGQIFSTKLEAEEKVKELIKAQELDRELRNKNIKELNIKKYSWHVGYHQKKIREAEKELEYHQRKIKVYKNNL